jgi:hypothetical protein
MRSNNRQRLPMRRDKFAWFNMGTNYVQLADLNPVAYQPKAFEYAVTLHDKARELNSAVANALVSIRPMKPTMR